MGPKANYKGEMGIYHQQPVLKCPRDCRLLKKPTNESCFACGDVCPTCGEEKLVEIGWIITKIKSTPAQPNLQVGDWIMGVAGVRFVGPTHADNRAIFKKHIRDGAELLVKRRPRLAEPREEKSFYDYN